RSVRLADTRLSAGATPRVQGARIYGTIAVIPLFLTLACGGGGGRAEEAAPDPVFHEAADQCDDGSDNDADGFVDCEDLDCRAESDARPLAPPLDRSVPTTIVSASEFLYQGADPVQKAVDPDDIEKPRFAVIRGRVTDID